MWFVVAVIRLMRALLEAVRLTFGRERLEVAPPRPRGTRRSGAPRTSFTPDALAFDPPAARRPRRGFARMLLAPEDLPFDPPVPRRPRSRWLHWLFMWESLDKP